MNASTVPQSTTYFAGKYVNDLRDLYLAGILSGLNAVSIGAPGFGKTEVALSMVADIAPDHHAMVRIHPATMPEEVKGAVNTPTLLKESRVEFEVTGTPFDPSNRVVIVDEIGRANRVIVGLLMQLLDRKDVQFPAPVIATSNFMPNSPESEALLDRIALWHWVGADLNVEEMLTAQLQANNGRMRVRGKLPTLNEVEAVWQANPGPQAIKAVVKSLGLLATEAQKAGLTVHPRRLWQWQRLLFRASVYFTGDEDFATVPNEAIRLLRFAWPCKTAEEYERWCGIAAVSVDAAGLLLEAYEADWAAYLNKFVADNGHKPLARKEWPGLIKQMMDAIGNAQTKANFALVREHEPERAEASIKKTEGWIWQALAGEEIDPLAPEETEQPVPA